MASEAGFAAALADRRSQGINGKYMHRAYGTKKPSSSVRNMPTWNNTTNRRAIRRGHFQMTRSGNDTSHVSTAHVMICVASPGKERSEDENRVNTKSPST